MARAGATELVLALRPSLGPEGLRTLAREVAIPLREGLG